MKYSDLKEIVGFKYMDPTDQMAFELIWQKFGVTLDQKKVLGMFKFIRILKEPGFPNRFGSSYQDYIIVVLNSFCDLGIPMDMACSLIKNDTAFVKRLSKRILDTVESWDRPLNSVVDKELIWDRLMCRLQIFRIECNPRKY